MDEKGIIMPRLPFPELVWETKFARNGITTKVWYGIITLCERSYAQQHTITWFCWICEFTYLQ